MGTGKRRAWTPASARNYVRNTISAGPVPVRSALRSFAVWLEVERGLTVGTIGVRILSARSFVEAMCARTRTSTARTFRTVTARQVEDFFVEYAKTGGPVARRSMQAAMRLFLRFAADRGWVARELACAVPSMRRYRLSGVPRALANKDLRRLLRSIRDDGSARDQTMVYLLASYGVRRGQVSALRFEDIDWRARTILFRSHKRGKAILHELVPAVADALVRYLREERPSGDDDFIFLRQHAPYVRLSPCAVNQVVMACMSRCGLPRRSSHSLRHAFASQLLRVGQSLKTIADLLGHRSFSTVAIYAKLDQRRLLEAAREWPEASS